MTGRSYKQIDDQKHFSILRRQLHPKRFSKEIPRSGDPCPRQSRDPLTPAAVSMLNELERDGNLPLSQAQKLLPVLVSCFERQHGHQR